MDTNLTIVVGGQIASVPFQGGATWAVLQYILGLQELGYNVYFMEHIPGSVLTPVGTDLAHSRNALYFNGVMENFGLGDSSALCDPQQRQSVGLDYTRIVEITSKADVMINLSGDLPVEPLLKRVPIRLYLDLDPLFTQLWNDVEKIDMHFADHTHFATIGMNVGSNVCTLPTGGLDWIKTWQPVVLSHWPVSNRLSWDAATTVANWRSYGALFYRGTFYGQKVHSWRTFIGLPLRSRWKFMPALSIDPREIEDINLLVKNGWQLVDPHDVAATPERYQDFIQGSKAELAIAKSGYVASHCGWFSERSECYLASGKPVVAQTTGFEQYLPCGKGLIAFNSNEQVLEALAMIESDYRLHCHIARQVAEEFFDSRRVLPRLLAQVGVAG